MTLIVWLLLLVNKDFVIKTKNLLNIYCEVFIYPYYNYKLSLQVAIFKHDIVISQMVPIFKLNAMQCNVTINHHHGFW